MGVLAEIKDILKIIALNQKVAKWVALFLIIIGVGGFLYFKYKPEKETDCAYIKQQNKELLAFILEAKKQVQELAQPTSYIGGNKNGFIFASFDTIPKKMAQQQQQKKVATLLYKFDSLLYKVRQDSIKRAKKS